jgi:phosphatidate cytidylyltransferase
MFLFSGKFFSFIIYIASILALYEWSKLLYFKSHEKKIFLFISLCFIYLIDKYLSYDDAKFLLIGASIFWICIAPSFLIFKIHLKNFFLSALIGWILVMPLIISLNYLIQLSPWVVLLVLTTIWLADSGAYFFGKQFGKRKLAPSISPGKTWAGFFGGIFFGLVGVWFLTKIMSINVSNSFWVFGTAAVFLAHGGDLLESWCKRYFNVKDSGSFLPGHGGLLDRLDSLLAISFAVALFWYFGE